MWSAEPCPAFREARGASRLVSEEKLDPCTTSAKLTAHRASGHWKRGGCSTGTSAGENTRLPLLLAGLGRIDECPVRGQAGWKTSGKDNWTVLQLSGMAVPDVAAWG